MSSIPPAEPPRIRWSEKLKDGSHVLIRPLLPEDREREAEFISNLSPEARYFRFFRAFQEPSPGLLDFLMNLDYRNTMAFVALVHRNGRIVEVGIARYGATAPDSCECAVVVADDWRRKGLASLLIRHLLDYARSQGFAQMYSVDAPTNRAVQSLASYLGSECRRDPDDPGQLIHSMKLR